MVHCHGSQNKDSNDYGRMDYYDCLIYRKRELGFVLCLIHFGVILTM